MPYKIRNYLRPQVIDSIKVYLKGGSGGNGLPKYGGIGGKGGNIYAVVNEEATLMDIKDSIERGEQYKAGPGENSNKNKLMGKQGESLLINVPNGVSIFTGAGVKLGELVKKDSKLILAEGGTGGCSSNQFLGQKGQEQMIRIDLKLISDIGLVGFPNAGKSTLLRAISRAKPRIAAYPFTTVKPTIGIIEYDDRRQISMADLPGLIEGAHLNIGLGHTFLRHVERTKLILVVVDVNGFQLSHRYPYRTPADTVILLNKELEMYNDSLLNKPCILLVSKMDSPGAEQKFNDLKDQLQRLHDFALNFPEDHRPTKLFRFDQVIPIAAKYERKSVQYLRERLRTYLDIYDDMVRNENERQLAAFRNDLQMQNVF